MRRIYKSGVLATGMLAAVAFAAPAAASPETDAHTLMADAVARSFGGSDHRQAFLAAATGSAASAAAWQVCGSATVAGVGATVDTARDLMYGDCANANARLSQDTAPPVIGALNDSAVLALPWQVCGSDAVAGVGATVSVHAPKTVVGDCRNANVHIDGDEHGGYLERAAARRPQPRPHRAEPRSLHRHDPQALASVGSGSAVIVAPWQICGSAAVGGVGVTVPVNSPHTVYGDCDNANVRIEQDEPTAVVSVADNSAVIVAAWQVCGSDAVAGVGAVVNVNSPNVVYGDCNNANVTID